MTTIAQPTGLSTSARSTRDTRAPSKAMRWTGRVLSSLAALFLTFDGAFKLIQPEAVVQGAADLGYPPSTVIPMGVLLLVGVALYVVPRTSILGAIHLTGYLGGAVATHVRVENPLFSHTLFPIYVAAFVWVGLWLRDARLRALVPLRAAPEAR